MSAPQDDADDAFEAVLARHRQRLQQPPALTLTTRAPIPLHKITQSEADPSAKENRADQGVVRAQPVFPSPALGPSPVPAPSLALGFAAQGDDDKDEQRWLAHLRSFTAPAPNAATFTVPKRGSVPSVAQSTLPLRSSLFSTAAVALLSERYGEDTVSVSRDDAETLQRERDALLQRTRTLTHTFRTADARDDHEEEHEGEDAMDALLETMNDRDAEVFPLPLPVATPMDLELELSPSKPHSPRRSPPHALVSLVAASSSFSSSSSSFSSSSSSYSSSSSFPSSFSTTTSTTTSSKSASASPVVPSSPPPISSSSRFRTPTPKHAVVRTTPAPSPIRTPFKTPTRASSSTTTSSASASASASATTTPLSSKRLRDSVSAAAASPYAVPSKRARLNNATDTASSPSEPKIPPRPASLPLFDLSPSSEPRVTLRAMAELHGMFHDSASVMAYGLPLEVVEMTSATAEHFRFVVCGEELGPDELYRTLLAEGARPSSEFSLSWARNAWRWIVWKLACTERRFPHVYRDTRRLLTLERVRSQLAYRYERECVRAQRPSLRRLLERDSPSALHLVLMVAAIISPTVVELSDGWYGVRAELDAPLSARVGSQRLFVGLKLHVLGCELIGPAASEAMAIQQASECAEPVLRLRYNRVVRAAWHTRLGLQRQLHVPRALTCVHVQGGSVQCLELRVETRYPLLFLETTRYKGETRIKPCDLLKEEARALAAERDPTIDLDGEEEEEEEEEGGGEDKDKEEVEERREYVTRSELGEARASASHEAVLQRVLNAHLNARLRRIELDEGEATSELRLAERMQRVHSELERVRERCSREVTPLLELRCSDAPLPGRAASALRECLLRVWSPPLELLDLRAGQTVRVFDVEPPRQSSSSSLPHGVSRERSAPVPMLHCSRRTQWRLINRSPAVLPSPSPSPPLPLRELMRRSSGDEFDALGVLLAVSARVPSERRGGLHEQRAFLLDVGGALLCLVLRRRDDDFPALLPSERTLWPSASAPLLAVRYASYSLWDARAGWHVAEAVAHCEVTRAETLAAWETAVTRLRRWREVSEDSVAEAHSRIAALVV